MGTTLFDRYSLAHFASGVAAYHLNISFIIWMIIHIMFEFVENTEKGIEIINKYPLLRNHWLGGKRYPDAFINSMVGDNFSAAMGWLISDYLYNN